MKILNKLFKEKTDNTLIQFFRYIFAGGSATIVDWGASSLSYLGLSALLDNLTEATKTSEIVAALIANTLGFIFGLIVNYIISTKWVFTEDTDTSQKKVFLQFAAIGIVGLIITWIITFAMTSLLNSVPAVQMVSKITSTAVSFLWNFFARKYIVFGKNEK